MTTSKRKSQYPGFLVTFEGGEGAGKSTQIKRLTQWLTARKIPYVLSLEPGGTIIGRRIRELLLNPEVKSLSSRTELLLYEADRAQHAEEVIWPALKSGHVVVCDRFADSSSVYQGICRKLGLEWTIQLNDFATQGLSPDLTLLLDLPETVGLARVRKRIQKDKNLAGMRRKVKQFKLDRMERETKRFHRQVRRGFLLLAKKSPRRFYVIDATSDETRVWDSIEFAVSRRLTKKGIFSA